MKGKFKHVGFVGRFKPLHNGAFVVLDELCKHSEQVFIGIGSSNKYNLRNPFTLEETADMIRVALTPPHVNYTIIPIPDFAHILGHEDGQAWRNYVKEKFSHLDAFFSSNDYVRALLKEDYPLFHSTDVLRTEQWTQLRAAEVRVAMLSGEQWKTMVPKPVAGYIEQKGLVERFRREFGPELEEQLAKGLEYSTRENAFAEKMHTRER